MVRPGEKRKDAMSLLTGIRNAIDNLLIPHDGLYDQAREVISHNDPDGDGRVDVQAIQSGDVTPPPGLLGITSRGFAQADADGDGNGSATVREVRSLLKRYDTGNGLSPGAAGDRTIDGFELLRLLGDLAAPAPSAATEQAARGAQQAA